ncbi:MAG: hypothetical protein K8T20_11660 [Planctomycetes bacterium]|nr:hypothetical protein [Planctomycetota bacterium]
MNPNRLPILVFLAALLAILVGWGIVRSRKADQAEAPVPQEQIATGSRANPPSVPTSSEERPAVKLHESSLESRKVAGHAMDVVTVRSQVTTWLELLDKGELERARPLEESIRKHGSTAKEVLNDFLKSGRVSENCQSFVRSTYESIP